MNFDVVVVGGGPAGLSAAFAAAMGGAHVAVLEKSKEIGYPIHTSGGSWIADLRLLGIPEKFMSPVTSGLFISPNCSQTVTYDKPEACILDVRGLYQHLAEQAAEAGARLFVNAPALRLHYDGERIAGVEARVLGATTVLRAPLIIDASGMTAFAAGAAELSKHSERKGVGAEFDLFAPDWPSGQIALVFGSQIAPSGYGWIFPHRSGRVRAGVGLIYPESRQDPRACLERLLALEPFRQHLTRRSELEYHAGTVPGGIFSERTAADHLLVVGDAGGLISTFLGEGIRFAIDIGRQAGAVAAEAVLARNFTVDFLKRFESRWKRKYERLFRVGASLNSRFSRYSDKQWDEKIQALGQLSPALVARLLRGDFTTTTLIGLIRASPGLATKAALSRLKSTLKELDFGDGIA